MTRTGIHECRIGMPKQWSYRDSGKESTRIPIQSHENPDSIPVPAPSFEVKGIKALEEEVLGAPGTGTVSKRLNNLEGELLAPQAQSI